MTIKPNFFVTDIFKFKRCLALKCSGGNCNQMTNLSFATQFCYKCQAYFVLAFLMVNMIRTNLITVQNISITKSPYASYNTISRVWGAARTIKRYLKAIGDPCKGGLAL